MAIKLKDAISLNENEIISLVGGGGKTTLLFWLARELCPQGVVLTTTTKMKYPLVSVPLVYWEDRHQVQAEVKTMLLLKRSPFVANGLLPQQQKIQGLKLDQMRELAELKLATTIVIEADGAKGRSLKGYRHFEPVLTPLTTLLIQVVGADIIGKKLSDQFVHCPEKIAEGTGLQLEVPLDIEAISSALLYPYDAWQKYLVSARKVVVINKVDTIKEAEPAKLLAMKLIKSRRVDKVLLTVADCGQVLQVYDQGDVL